MGGLWRQRGRNDGRLIIAVGLRYICSLTSWSQKLSPVRLLRRVIKPTGVVMLSEPAGKVILIRLDPLRGCSMIRGLIALFSDLLNKCVA
jgi:hypothetical protein